MNLQVRNYLRSLVKMRQKQHYYVICHYYHLYRLLYNRFCGTRVLLLDI